jgi:hypothetical protein
MHALDIRFHKIRELVEQGTISLEKVVTHDNAADVLTKSLSMEKHHLSLCMLRVVS